MRWMREGEGKLCQPARCVLPESASAQYHSTGTRLALQTNYFGMAGDTKCTRSITHLPGWEAAVVRAWGAADVGTREADEDWGSSLSVDGRL